MLSIASSTGHFDHSYTCIQHLIVEDFAFEVHHGRFHFFVQVFLLIFGFKRGFSRVLLEFSKILIFSCVILYFLAGKIQLKIKCYHYYYNNHKFSSTNSINYTNSANDQMFKSGRLKHIYLAVDSS